MDHKNDSLFNGIDENEKEKLIKVLCAERKRYRKGSRVVSAGSTVDKVYYLEEGEMLVENNGYGGELFILSKIEKGGIFGGAFAFSREICSSDVVAEKECVIITIPAERIISPIERTREYELFLSNFIGVLAAKSVSLLQKIGHISAKGIRGKVLSYLSAQAKAEGRAKIVIPFSRQELADYLGVDRSALSKELSSMRDDGLIEYRKNEFILLKR